MGRRSKLNHRHPNRNQCGDGEILNLRSSLIRAEAAFRASIVAEKKAESDFKEASQCFTEVNEATPAEVTLLMSKVELLNEKLAHCDNNAEALHHNVEMQKLFDQRQALEEGVIEAESAATIRKMELKEATAARKACEKELTRARTAYSQHYIGKLSALGIPVDEIDSFEVVLASDGQTHARRIGQKRNGIHVLFRNNGSVVESTVKSCMDFFDREKSTEDMAAKA